MARVSVEKREVYFADEAAEVLGVGINTVYELIHRADFPAVQLRPRRWVIPKQALSDWLMKQATGDKGAAYGQD